MLPLHPRSARFVISVNRRGHYARHDVGPADQPPVAIDAAAERDLLADLGAGGPQQGQLGGVGAHAEHLGADGAGADVDHEHLALGQLGHFRLLAVGGAHAQQPAQQEVVDLELRVDGRQPAAPPQHVAHQPVRPAQRGVDARAHADQAARHGELEVVVLGEQADDAAEDGHAADGAVLVLGHDARADLDLVAEPQHAGQDAAAGHAALEVVDLGPRLVDVEAADDDHVRGGGEVAAGHGDAAQQLLVDGVDVVLELGRDGHHGRAVGRGAADELEDGLVVLRRALLAHQVHLVLQDDDVVQLHDLDGRQVLRRLRLRARLVARDQQQRRVHDGRARQHGAHEDVVAGAIDEAGSQDGSVFGTHVAVERVGLTTHVFAVDTGRCSPGARTAGPPPSRS